MYICVCVWGWGGEGKGGLLYIFIKELRGKWVLALSLLSGRKRRGSKKASQAARNALWKRALVLRWEKDYE